MINNIKMNLYRILHTEVLMRTLPVAVVCFLGLSLALDLYQKDSMKNQLSSSDGVVVEMSIEGTDTDNDSILDYYVKSVTSGFISMLFVIGSTIFVVADYNNGFAKNVVGQMKHRSYNLIGKMAAVFVYIFVFMVFFFVLNSVTYLIENEGNVVLLSANDKMIALKILLAYFMNVAFVGFYSMLAIIVRGSTLAMIIGIMSTLGLVGLLFEAIQGFFHFIITDKLLFNNLMSIPYAESYQNLGRIFFIGITFMIIYHVIGIIVVEKRDVV